MIRIMAGNRRSLCSSSHTVGGANADYKAKEHAELEKR